MKTAAIWLLAAVALCSVSTAAAAPKWSEIDVRACGRTITVRSPESFPSSTDVALRVFVHGLEPTATSVNTYTAQWAGRGIIVRMHQFLGYAPLQWKVASVLPGCVKVRLLYRVLDPVSG